MTSRIAIHSRAHTRTHTLLQKSTTIVLVYKKHSISQQKRLHFFLLPGWYFFRLLYKENEPLSTPKETAHLMALKSCQLRGFFSVCDSSDSHRIMTQNAQLSPFDLFSSLDCFFSFSFFLYLLHFSKTHKVQNTNKQKNKNKWIKRYQIWNSAWAKCCFCKGNIKAQLWELLTFAKVWCVCEL